MKTKQKHTPGGLAGISAQLRDLAVQNRGIAEPLHEIADALWAQSLAQRALLEAAKLVSGCVFPRSPEAVSVPLEVWREKMDALRAAITKAELRRA